MAQPVQPEKAYFKDDGSIPNSGLPLLLYRQALAVGSPDLAAVIEERFAKNDWIVACERVSLSPLSQHT
jgi:uncharacterized protein YjlB